MVSATEAGAAGCCTSGDALVVLEQRLSWSDREQGTACQQWFIFNVACELWDVVLGKYCVFISVTGCLRIRHLFVHAECCSIFASLLFSGSQSACCYSCPLGCDCLHDLWFHPSSHSKSYSFCVSAFFPDICREPLFLSAAGECAGSARNGD